MQFGGWSHWGVSGFGGAPARALVYYQILRTLRPPRVYPDDANALCNKLLKIDAWGLEHGQSIVDAIEREIFPDAADELLEDWERLFDLVPPAWATLSERLSALLARWRGGVGTSVHDLRALLAPLLRPSTAFRDHFPGTSLSWRWAQSLGAGTVAVASSVATLALAGAAVGDWSASGRLGPLVSMPLVDPDDSVTIIARVPTFTAGGNGVQGGIALYRDDANAILLGLVRSGGSTYVQVDTVIDGVYAANVARSGAVTPPTHLRAVKDGIRHVLSWSTETAGAPTSWTELVTVSSNIVRPTCAAIWASNSGTHSSVDLGVDSLEFSHGKQQNNVEVIERTQACGATGAPLLMAFVHREPSDAGSYDLAEAQRQADRSKMGHVLVLVGESDYLICDSDHDLVDRDILGV